jgi:hypothetical protein
MAYCTYNKQEKKEELKMTRIVINKELQTDVRTAYDVIDETTSEKCYQINYYPKQNRLTIYPNTELRFVPDIYVDTEWESNDKSYRMQTTAYGSLELGTDDFGSFLRHQNVAIEALKWLKEQDFKLN